MPKRKVPTKLFRVTVLVGDTYECVVRARSRTEALEFAQQSDPFSDEGWELGETSREADAIEVDDTADGEAVIDLADE